MKFFRLLKFEIYMIATLLRKSREITIRITPFNSFPQIRLAIVLLKFITCSSLMTLND